jgi:hypothetical protein
MLVMTQPQGPKSLLSLSKQLSRSRKRARAPTHGSPLPSPTRRVPKACWTALQRSCSPRVTSLLPCPSLVAVPPVALQVGGYIGPWDANCWCRSLAHPAAPAAILSRHPPEAYHAQSRSRVVGCVKRWGFAARAHATNTAWEEGRVQDGGAQGLRAVFRLGCQRVQAFHRQARQALELRREQACLPWPLSPRPPGHN